MAPLSSSVRNVYAETFSVDCFWGCTPGPSYSKVTTSLVKFSKVKFSNMPVFFVEKM